MHGGMAEEIIFDGQDVLVWTDLTPSAPVVVAFGVAPDGQERRPFAAKFLAKTQTAAVHVLAKGRHWWQTPDMGPAIAAIRAATAPYSRRIGYSASMGGYGILMFSGELDLQHVVVASAQTTISDPSVPMAKGWGVANVLRDDVPGGIPSKLVPTLIFDPRMAIDAAHARWLGRRHPIRELYTPYSGHQSLKILKQGGMLNAFARRFVLGDADASEFRGMYRSSRANSATYRATIAALQSKRRLRTDPAPAD